MQEVCEFLRYANGLQDMFLTSTVLLSVSPLHSNTLFDTSCSMFTLRTHQMLHCPIIALEETDKKPFCLLAPVSANEEHRDGTRGWIQPSVGTTITLPAQLTGKLLIVSTDLVADCQQYNI